MVHSDYSRDELGAITDEETISCYEHRSKNWFCENRYHSSVDFDRDRRFYSVDQKPTWSIYLIVDRESHSTFRTDEPSVRIPSSSESSITAQAHVRKLTRTKVQEIESSFIRMWKSHHFIKSLNIQILLILNNHLFNLMTRNKVLCISAIVVILIFSNHHKSRSLFARIYNKFKNPNHQLSEFKKSSPSCRIVESKSLLRRAIT